MPFPNNPLDPSLLYLFVLGPGIGETVLVRIPDQEWIIIDSFQIEGRPAAFDIVDEFGGKVRALVLTHPHQDHCRGFIELVDEYADALIGAVHPRDTTGAGLPADPIQLLKERIKPTFTRIADEWDGNPSKQWRTFRSTTRVIGSATVESLNPTLPISKRQWCSANVNDLSSAMLLRWEQVTLLLAADVTNSIWPEIQIAYPNLGDHDVLKVPHHASKGAVHTSYGAGIRERFWIITPYANSRLPKSGAGEGIELCLSFVDKVHVTSLPYSHDREADAPCVAKRNDIASDSSPKRTGTMSTAASVRKERCIVVAYDRDGNLVDRWNGPGTLEIS